MEKFLKSTKRFNFSSFSPIRHFFSSQRRSISTGLLFREHTPISLNELVKVATSLSDYITRPMLASCSRVTHSRLSVVGRFVTCTVCVKRPHRATFIYSFMYINISVFQYFVEMKNLCQNLQEFFSNIFIFFRRVLSIEWIENEINSTLRLVPFSGFFLFFFRNKLRRILAQGSS